MATINTKNKSNQERCTNSKRLCVSLVDLDNGKWRCLKLDKDSRMYCTRELGHKGNHISCCVTIDYHNANSWAD
jgi:hypothetical protein